MAPRLWEWFEIPAPESEDGPRRKTHQNLRERLEEWLRADQSFDRLAEIVVTPGEGDFLNRLEDPRDRAEFYGRSLLGLRIGCARCHNHPLDRWKQDDHLRFSAWFATPRPSPTEPGKLIRGKFFLPGNRAAVSPALLPLSHSQEEEANTLRALDRPSHEILQDFLLQSGRPAFQRNAANRVFGWLTGRLLVDPADDHRLTNPALHVSILTALSDGSWSTLRELVRFVVTTRLYQVTSEPAAKRPLSQDPSRQYLARREAVPLTARQRTASIQQALGIPVASLPEAESPLARQLAHLNDARWQAALNELGNSLEGLALFEPDPHQRLSALFELILSRPPTPEEKSAFIDATADLSAMRDLAFALLNSREFGSKR